MNNEKKEAGFTAEEKKEEEYWPQKRQWRESCEDAGKKKRHTKGGSGFLYTSHTHIKSHPSLPLALSHGFPSSRQMGPIPLGLGKGEFERDKFWMHTHYVREIGLCVCVYAIFSCVWRECSSLRLVKFKCNQNPLAKP